jgi:hypothetical protein
MVVDVTPSITVIERRVEECINALMQVCTLFGFEGEVNTRQTQQHWMRLVNDTGGNWAKVAKYKLAAFYSFHTDQPIPPAPFQASDLPGKLFGGRAGRFTDLLLKRLNMEEKMEFLYSIKGAKGGMPRASKAELKEKEDELVIELTKEPNKRMESEDLLPSGEVWSDVPVFKDETDTVLSQPSFERQLRRTVRELYENQNYAISDRVAAFFPSTSANYINSRKNAGAIGAILEHPTLLDGLRAPQGHLHFDTKSEEEIQSEDWKVGAWDHKKFDEEFAIFWTRVLKIADEEEEPLAEPLALPEALKIRVITKGPPFQQTVLKGLQKYMHEVLRNHRTFKLVGVPITADYIYSIMGSDLAPGEGFLSGDYEAATNNLESWVSNTIADEIGDVIGLFPVERRLFLRSLTGHILRGRPQTRGQLMGSITSFPVLCIANAALSRWAWELDHGMTVRLSDCPLTINGDDIAMKCSRNGYKLWQRITQKAGLKESVGKTYWSREWVEMNSTNFVFDQLAPTKNYKKMPSGRYSIWDNPFKLTKYVKLGLINGLKRSGLSIGLRDQDDQDNNVGARYRKLIEMCPTSLKEAVHAEFVDKHRGLLQSMRLPWYVPEWIGGLGLTGVKEPSELDLRVAKMIIFNWKKQRPVSIAHSEANWRTWQLAEGRVPEPTYVETKNAGTVIYNKIVSKMCINLLFDSNIRLSDLHTEIKSGMNVKKAVRRNERLWDPSTYKSLPSPLTMQELMFRPKYSSYEDETPVDNPTVSPLD